MENFITRIAVEHSNHLEQRHEDSFLDRKNVDLRLLLNHTKSHQTIEKALSMNSWFAPEALAANPHCSEEQHARILSKYGHDSPESDIVKMKLASHTPHHSIIHKLIDQGYGHETTHNPNLQPDHMKKIINSEYPGNVAKKISIAEHPNADKEVHQMLLKDKNSAVRGHLAQLNNDEINHTLKHAHEAHVRYTVARNSTNKEILNHLANDKEEWVKNQANDTLKRIKKNG